MLGWFNILQNLHHPIPAVADFGGRQSYKAYFYGFDFLLVCIALGNSGRITKNRQVQDGHRYSAADGDFKPKSLYKHVKADAGREPCARRELVLGVV